MTSRLRSCGRDHLNAVLGDNADITGPRAPGTEGRVDERLQLFGNRRKRAKQDYAAALKWNRPLKGNLPEVFVERQDDASIRFGAFEQRSILEARTIGPCPKNVVVLPAYLLDDWSREVFIRQKSHSGWDGVSFVLVREVARVGEARKDVLFGEPRIIRENLALGLARSQQFKDKLDG